jgi:hypothetical protein
MGTLSVWREVEAEQEAVFALSQDYGARLSWDPFLRSLRFLGGAREAAPGVRVRVRARNGLAMEVEYLTLRPPAQVAVRMVRGPWFFRRFAGTWLFEPCGPGRTRVTFRYHFALRPGLLERWAAPLVDRVLRRDMAHRLAALQAHAERREAGREAAPPAPR